LLFSLLGVTIGISSILLIRGVYWFEDVFQKYFKNPYFRHIIGMFCVGCLLYLFMINFEHYYISGIGFATIQDYLKLVLINPWLLLLLFTCKLLATCLSLGTGSSGGIFSPALFLGATLGTLFGVL
jgi:chloride channel protein, CIC family